MKKLLLMLSLSIIMAAPALEAADNVIEIDFSARGYYHKQEMPEITEGDLTIRGYQGSRQYAPQYYSTYNAMVFWGTNFMTIECATKAIERIEFVSVADIPMEQDKVFSDKGTIVVNEDYTAEWTNNRPVDMLVVSPKSNTIELGCLVRSMKIYLTDRPAAAAYAETPSVYPEGGMVFDNTDITITSPTEGATIYYTTDGSNPVVGQAGTNRYTGAFHLTESCVVKAIATATGMETSHIGSRGFSVPVTVSSISELLSMAKESVFYTINGDITVTYRCGSTCWIKDATGALSLFGDAITNKRPESGYKLRSVTGRFNLNNMNPELEHVAEQNFTPIAAEACQPKEMKGSDITKANINEYITVKNVTLISLGNDNYCMTESDGSSINIRNNYRIAIDNNLLDGKKTVDVELFPSLYKTELRYYIARVIDPEAVDPNPEPEPELPGDGNSAKTAYTVEEALDHGGDNFMSTAWVKGYIVGTFEQPVIGAYGNPTFGTDNANDQTLILADSKDCTDFDKCLKLILIQANVKKDLNLKDNPDMLGQYVATIGNMGANFQCMQGAGAYQFLVPPATTGIENVETDEDAPVEYFNLQGMPVNPDNLRAGQIYIRRCGNKATKIRL